MSGLYNMVFGVSDAFARLLTVLNLKPSDCGRFRDCYLTMSGEIAVYTRNGGGNREAYQPVLDQLAKHPQWIRDEDDAFDSTYATIYFRIPDEHREEIMRTITPELDRNTRWLQYIAMIQRPDDGGSH